MLIILSAATFLATFLGGLFALKFRDKLHLILGFSAGAVIGAAFFDLIPEAIELGGTMYEPFFITSLAALGFITYMILDRLFFHHCHDTHVRGKLGAGSLAIHSILDGVAIGLAFQVSPAVGMIVAIAVLVHDFSDGINTVSMIVKNNGGKAQAFKWLTLDAAAPVLGIISTRFFTLPESSLGIVLALFAGFFLYIGASDLLPESHHSHPTAWTTIATVLGMATLFGAITIAGI